MGQNPVDFIKELNELKGLFEPILKKQKTQIEALGASDEKTRAELTDAVKKFDEFCEQHKTLMDLYKAQKERLDELEAQGQRGHLGEVSEIKSAGDIFCESDAYQSFCDRKTAKSSDEVDVSEWLKKGGEAIRATKADHTSADITGLIDPQRLQPVGELRRPRRLREVMRSVPVSQNSIEYPQQQVTHALETELAANVLATDTELTLANANGVKPGAKIYVDSEAKEATVSSASDAVNIETGVVKLTGQAGFTATAEDTVFQYNFAPTAEAKIKPCAKIGWTLATAQCKNIGAWIPVTRQMVEDAPILRSLIDTDLRELVELAEEIQFIYGSGDNQEITGIWETSGVQTYGQVTDGKAGDTRIDAVRRASTLVALAFLRAAVLVIHPTDLELIETEKDENGRYINMQVQLSNGLTVLWRLQVLDTPAINQGEFIVGDFMMACLILDRQQMVMRIAEQHADFAVRGLMAMIADKRVGLMVHRPAGFVKGTFAS